MLAILKSIEAGLSELSVYPICRLIHRGVCKPPDEVTLRQKNEARDFSAHHPPLPHVPSFNDDRVATVSSSAGFIINNCVAAAARVWLDSDGHRNFIRQPEPGCKCAPVAPLFPCDRLLLQ